MIGETNVTILDREGMRDYGRRLGQTLGRGTVVALIGEPGAGKTFLTQAIAEGLDVAEPVTSPSFTIIHEHKSGRIPLYHFDVYRLDTPDEMDALGFEEYFYGDGVTVVEWADKIEGLLPAEAITVRIAYGPREDQRVVRGSIPQAMPERKP